MTTSYRDPYTKVPALSDDEKFAHAALIVSSRVTDLAVADVVEHLLTTAHDMGVDTVELARMIVEASEARVA